MKIARILTVIKQQSTINTQRPESQFCSDQGSVLKATKILLSIFEKTSGSSSTL